MTRIRGISSPNSTSSGLGVGGSFVGVGEDVSAYDCTLCAVKTDADGVLKIQYSPDNTNWDSSLSYTIGSNVNDVHRLSNARQYMRIIYLNGSTAQGYLRLQTMIGNQPPLTSTFNSQIQSDADTLITRSIAPNLDIARNKIQGLDSINKFGTISDVDTASVPQDIWNVGGSYLFPTTPSRLAIYSTNSGDASGLHGAWDCVISGLDVNYDALNEQVYLNGTGSVLTTGSFFRVNRARVTMAGGSGGNIGSVICVNQEGFTLFRMNEGENSTQISNFTMQNGKTGYLDNVNLYVSRQAAGVAEVALKIRQSGTNTIFATEDIYSANTQGAGTSRIYDPPKLLNPKSDIKFTVTNVSANNIGVSIGYDLVEIVE